MKELDLKLGWKFFVDLMVDKVSVLFSYRFLSSVFGFREVQADQRVAVLFEASGKVLTSRYRTFVQLFVEDDVRLRLQWVWNLRPEEWH
jgi:hypothetical protein